MKQVFAILVAGVFLVAARPAAPQAATQTPAPPQPPERPANERAPLNLKLDDPASFARSASDAETGPSKSLPSLGGDARPINPTSRPPSESPTFPKDTNPTR